jgi:hypothetical protein
MGRFEVEVSASVGGLSLTCGGWVELKLRYRPVWVGLQQTLMASVVPLLLTRTSKKGMTLTDSISVVNSIEELQLLRWLPLWAMRPDHRYDIVIPEPLRWLLLCQVKDYFIKMLHVNVANDGR